MHRIFALFLALCLGLGSVSPVMSQTSAPPTPMAASPDATFEPIPVPEDAGAGSSGPSQASLGSAGSTVGSIASTGSSIFGILGFVVVVAAVAVAASN
jgi:hypothetical protein